MEGMVALCFFYALLAVLVSGVSILTIAVFLRKKLPRRSTGVLLIGLAVVDLLIGTLVLPLFITVTSTHQPLEARFATELLLGHHNWVGINLYDRRDFLGENVRRLFSFPSPNTQPLRLHRCSLRTMDSSDQWFNYGQAYCQGSRLYQRLLHIVTCPATCNYLHLVFCHLGKVTPVFSTRRSGAKTGKNFVAHNWRFRRNMAAISGHKHLFDRL